VSSARTISLLLVIAAFMGCGDEDGETTPTERSGEVAAEQNDTATTAPTVKRGVLVTLRDSDFGPMLFDSNEQAIYVFERDRHNTTVCYGECAAAWPPVFSKGRPRAGRGVRPSLLGTIRRRDGRRQVTYAGRPLYFYAHEDPGTVLCHNVRLNGGLWWAIGSDGRRRPA
jgi:predicted lipoprotein with Yx(FWY)xxD motif